MTRRLATFVVVSLVTAALSTWWLYDWDLMGPFRSAGDDLEQATEP